MNLIQANKTCKLRLAGLRHKLINLLEDLPPFSDIQMLGPKDMNGEDNAGSIGLIPTTGLFNDGKPSVIHGEVVAALD